MTKVKRLSLTGIRGVRNGLNLELNGKSCLLYGENGTGKSTISDAVEWFFYDKIEHLSSEEIGRKGIDALRNIYLDDKKDATVGFEFSDSSLSCTKSIEIKNGKTSTTSTNSSPDFLKLVRQSQKENLVLRYRDLVTFVVSTKGDKLRELSEIIGFSKVTKTRDLLQKAANSLSRDITNRNFENQINHQQKLILEQFGENITTEKEFVDAVNSLIKDFDLGIKVNELGDVNTVLEKIKKPDDSEETKQESYLTLFQEKLVDYPVHLQQLEERYGEYRKKFEDIVADLDKLKKLALDKLLSAGHELLESKGHDEESCPLCLQDKSQKDLIAELGERIAELEAVKNENKQLADANSALRDQISLTEKAINQIVEHAQSKNEKNSQRKKTLSKVLEKAGRYKDTLKQTIHDGKSLPEETDLKIDVSSLSELEKGCKEELEAIKKERKKDPKWDVHSKINIAGHAYAQVRTMKAEQATYETQRDTMGELSSRFIKAQKDALTSFLDSYSGEIDKIYQFLNPGERVENIAIVPFEKNGELIGLTIEFDFLDEKSTSPPHKYLSESHLNCLGLAAFLASADAFNKENSFLVLDDVISSFDTEHRKRFADLIVEKYGDRQIILLTHEESWFPIISNRAKKKGWKIHTIKYNDLDGTYLDDPPKTLKEEVQAQVDAGDSSGLGNKARKYLERLLKDIAVKLSVRVVYKPNERNEKRMAHELLLDLRSRLKAVNCNELLTNPVIERLIDSTSIANTDSHDNDGATKFADLKGFWQDVQDFEKLFSCETCSTNIATKYAGSSDKKIQCKDGHLSYSWKA